MLQKNIFGYFGPESWQSPGYLIADIRNAF